MPILARRQLLAGAALAGGAALFPRLACAAGPSLPVARVEPVTDRLWGETIVDPYRWMENPADPDWLPWITAQNDATRRTLDALPRRAAFLRRIGELSGAVTQVVNARAAAGTLFFERRMAGETQYRLFARLADGREQLLADPESFGRAGENASVDWWLPAPDGRHVVLGVSLGGTEAAVGHVVEVASGKLLADRLADVPYAAPAWLPNGIGFFYNRFAGRPIGAADYYNDRTAWLHRVGTAQVADVKVAGAGVAAGVTMSAISSPELQTGVESAYVAMTMHEGYQRGFALYLARRDALLAGRPEWRRICGPDDGIADLALSGDHLFLVATAGSERGRLLRLDAATGTLATATVVLPEGPAVIDELNAGVDGTWVTLNDGGEQRLAFQPGVGVLQPVALPYTGWIQAVAVDPGSGEALVRVTGWLNPPTLFRAAPHGSVRDTGLQSQPALGQERFAARRLFATAKDGTRVPVTVIAAKGPPRVAPCFVHVYGAYQWPSQPIFDTRSLAWLEAGGTIATAHVRGGGEYGRAWHEGGMKVTKPNTWRDLIACCEALVRAGYAQAGKIAIDGGSAGGIAVSRAMEERPELFGAVVHIHGMANTLRAEFEPNGQPNIPEFGTVKEEAGYRALKAMDGYHGVQPGRRYPPVLLTTGLNDARVAPYNSGKLAARLRAANAGNVALLSVDMAGGHVANALARDQADREAADVYAFVWAALSSEPISLR
jgi:prolyl oligopeptidase